jgi:hypothetical protein
MGGALASMAETTNAYRIFVGKPQGRDLSENKA